MSWLSRLEAALERIAEGGAERVFGGRLDLVAVGQELYNRAVAGSREGADGPRAPNAYGIRFALDDYGHVSHEVEALQAKYAVSLWSRLREAGYALDTPPGVLITPDERVAAGSTSIEAAFVSVAPAFTLSNLAGRGAVYRLKAPATLGRGRDCDLPVDAASVSRRHAQVVWSRNGFAVVDLHSSNGTRLNGVDISGAPLEAGDTLALGDVHFQFAPELAPLPIGGDGAGM